MPPNTAKDTAAQAQSAFIPAFSAGKRDPSEDLSGSSQPPQNSDYRQHPNLIAAELNILAARQKSRRNGSGCFTVLTVVHSEYQGAVCFSERLPFAATAGQKVRVRGRQAEYQGKRQIIFQMRDIQLVSEPADNADLITIDATVGRISVQNHGRAWKAFRISCRGFESAAGDIAFDIHDGQRLRLCGFKGAYMGKPQLLVVHAEPLGVEYADDRRRIFAQSKIPPRYFDRLVAALGSDFATRLSGEPALISSVLPRIKPAMCAKIADACVRIEAQDAFSAALRRCSVPEPTVAALIAKHPDGLARLTAYDLIDYSFLDEDRTRGPRRGLTGNEADKLAQSEYALRFRPFDPQSLERARCHIEHLARERIELRGDAGASISRILSDLEKRYAFPKTVSQKAIALLAEERVFTIDPMQPDHLWLTSEARAEAAIAKSAHARLANDSGPAPTRRVVKNVTLFPAAGEPRLIELSQGQRDAAKTALANRMSIICGPPGVGKTSVLAALIKLGGDRVMITAIAAAAVQRAREVTGGQGKTVASLTTDFPRWGDLRLSPRPDRLHGIDTLILDEASMIGSRQLATLMKGCDLAGVTRLVLCGDPDQLPPIQSGAPFADTIRSGVVPVARLETIFRSASGSGVQNLVEAIRLGGLVVEPSQSGSEFPSFGDGVEFLSGDKATANAILAKYLELASDNGEADTAVLSPFKSEQFGVHALNAQLRAALGFDTPAPRPGEIVMCVENALTGGDDRFRLLNGMRLIVTEFDGEWLVLRHLSSAKTATVRYKPHAHGPAETIVWGRAATVHKFQGSEAAAVIVVIPPNALRLIEKEPHIFDVANFYTGVSRAKKRVVIMGALDQLPDLMKHGTRRRITRLERLLTEARHD
jgi:AAA domain/UvrD-like helicase C-terminal domain